ncbi:MAG: DUF1571 domain-containing protein [Planctomycetaceae bacterium]
MTRSSQPPVQPVGTKRRNFVALLLAGVSLGILYLNFDPTPAGGQIGDNVDLTNTMADIAVPTDGDAVSSESKRKGGPHKSNAKNALHGRTALLMCLMLTERGIRKLESVDTYSATFYKKERVGGRVGEPQVMQMKIRHKPFGVFMRWLVGDKGQELLYVAGEHDGNMLVKLGGVKGRLLPTLKLDPKGDRALKASRYPVTDIGLLNLAKKIAGYRRRDIEQKSGVKCRMFDDQVFNDRKCFCFVIDYLNSKLSPPYRKSVIFIDKEWCIPVCVQNFGWTEESFESVARLDKETALEDYRYSNIRLKQKLADAEFSRSYKGYRLK